VLPLLYLHGLSSGDFVPALEQFLDGMRLEGRLDIGGDGQRSGRSSPNACCPVRGAAFPSP